MTSPQQARPKSSFPDPTSEIWALCRARKDQLCYLRYTLEAYEGLCVPTTLPGGDGLVRIASSEGQRSAVAVLLEALASEIGLEVLEWGSAPMEGCGTTSGASE